MKAFVDQEACIGCALCPSLCPEVFEMNENDKAQAIEGEIPKEANESATHARNNCPVDAISID